MILSTHTEIIHLPEGGRAIVTGVPDTCEHNDDLVVFTLANGDNLFEKDYRCPTNEETAKYVHLVAEQRNTWVNGGTVACSKCFKVHSLQDLMGDAYWM